MYTFEMCKLYGMKKSLLGSCRLAVQFPFQKATTNISGFLYILEVSVVLCITSISYTHPGTHSLILLNDR